MKQGVVYKDGYEYEAGSWDGGEWIDGEHYYPVWSADYRESHDGKCCKVLHHDTTGDVRYIPADCTWWCSSHPPE